MAQKRKVSGTESTAKSEESGEDASDSGIELNGPFFSSDDGSDLDTEDSTEGFEMTEEEGDEEEPDESDDLLDDSEDDVNLTDEEVEALLSRRRRELGNTIEEEPDTKTYPELEEDEPNYEITTDANGGIRYIYKEIDPVYDSDDSDAPVTKNTIGNIPLSFYDMYPHIGYDISGKKLARPAKGDALDSMLESIEIPKGWTGLMDPATGKPLELSQDELQLLKQIQLDEIPGDGYNPYEPTVEWFTSKVEQMPLSAAPEPKRRFVKSRAERKLIMRIVKGIKEGRIKPYKEPSAEDQEEEEFVPRYDLWANEAPRPDHIMNIPAPKLPPPSHEASYHPPPEYLPDEEEKKEWEEADEEDRKTPFLPRDHSSLRKVGAYAHFVKDVFERCLDLYLAPRVRRSKLNIDPESLLPKLPSVEELRPFPSVSSSIFRGHGGRVRSLDVDPSGQWVATGGEDGTIRVWELQTGHQTWAIKLGADEAVNAVSWRPGHDAFILAAAHAESLYMLIPPLCSPELEKASHTILDAGWGYSSTSSTTTTKKPQYPWIRPSAALSAKQTYTKTTLRSTIKSISWHRRGNYLSTVSPSGQSSAVAIHTLSKHLTQFPFPRLKGLPQTASFHPSKPHFFIATQRTIKIYDLTQQLLLKTLQPGARWLSSISIHPGGDNVLASSYDRRLLWHDLDLDNKPYKTLRYHDKAIRSVAFHPGGFPLFVDASDDGTLQVFHGSVVGDLMENAKIVPLKMLRGHKVTGALGVLDVGWDPGRPWCVSVGADGLGRLWV